MQKLSDRTDPSDRPDRSDTLLYAQLTFTPPFPNNMSYEKEHGLNFVLETYLLDKLKKGKYLP